MIDLENPVLVFNALDRCDRCGAQAYTAAQKDGFVDLLFCLHHRREFEWPLLDDGWTIVDDYEAIERLVVGPGASV